ncbi:probable G-protein coupled receptor Mth-like 8 isoform X2 [Bactrocera tryoni]|uniref:probable G-protein coupled receptor Mth-like 8 isoform X2 n=1 Tax=Bactrocera tryoni TaxID=59916 RepID=UPI001A99F762|nr:probable G-protein coupled receptor Mth-like 8 isoform X2 [Bactrocera tryoni]
MSAQRHQGVSQMCAPTLVKAIKDVRADVATRQYSWSLIAAFVIIISSCCCCSSVTAAASSAAADTRYHCAFIDTINVTGIAWAYEQSNATAGLNSTSNNNTNNNDNTNNKNYIVSSNNSSASSNKIFTDNNNNISDSSNNNNNNIIASKNSSDTDIHNNNNITAININNNNNNITNNNSINDNNNDNAALLRSLGITHIPPELVAAYTFIIKDGIRVPVERHMRACICKLKPCIRFCCAEGHYYDTLSKSCVSIASVIDADMVNATQQQQQQQQPHSLAFALTGMDHHEVAVRHSNGSTRLVRTAHHFNVNIGVPCARMRYVHRDNQLVHWTLFENGSIAHRNYLFSNYYCYTPHQLDNITWEWQPLACVPKKLPFVLTTKEWTYAICLILAVICMFIILFIYLFASNLRNTFYGVAIKVYTLCIIFGYSIMAHLTLTDPAEFMPWTCINLPACVIIYMVLSFYILSLISFNFYMHFHDIIMSRLMFWIIFFPIALLTIGWSIFAANNDYDGRAIFGGGDTCWFDPRNWSIMVYYYAPIFIACVVCIFFYILTLIRISEGQDYNFRKATGTLDENRFKSFFKFFSYTFIVFLVCVTSFAINYYREDPTHINYAVCLFIIFHGFGALYALIGQNQEVQNFLRRIEDDVSDDDEMTDSAVPMSGF